MGFEYPITRPYPWRFATLGILIVSSISFILIVYFNLAIVGTETSTYISTEFQPKKDPSWTDRMNIKTMIDFHLGCDPTTLVVGSSYRTTNGAFTYRAQSFVNRDTKEAFSSIGYSATFLKNCSIEDMGMFADSIAFDARFQVNVMCSLPDGIDMRVTAESMVTLRDDTDSSIMKRYQEQLVDRKMRTTYIAPAISKLLVAFGIDFLNQFLPDIPYVTQNIRLNSSLTTVYAPLTIHDDMRFFHLNGTFSAHGRVQQQPGVRDVFGQNSLSVYENFAYVFWSGVLSDLGMSGRPNLLTNADLFDQSIRQDLQVYLGVSLPWLPGPAFAVVRSNKTAFELPFKQLDPTFFNAQYICRSTSWKPPADLIVDVLVATVSFFTLLWSAMHSVAGYFAVKSSAHGNHCTCNTCAGSLDQKPSEKFPSGRAVASSPDLTHESLLQHDDEDFAVQRHKYSTTYP